MILRRARRRLAVVFATAQLTLAVAFAFAVYGYVTIAFDFDGPAESGVGASAEAGFAVLRSGLVWACLALLLIAPVTSWLLAGMVLRPVRRSFEAQERFVDDASHELRTPLTAIRAQLELAVHRQRAPDEYVDAIRRSLVATTVLEQTLSDLLVLSQSDREISADRTPVRLSAVLDRCVSLLPDVAQRVIAEVDDTATVEGLPGLLDRLLLNLLSNAARYSPAVSPIRVRIARRPNGVALTVTDTGIGMRASEITHATERFWRADSSRASDGNGLGLAIVRQIADLHHARLTIESTVGAGTSVGVLFPLSR
ncbi:sensor histidine kinase [Naasia lichenicola]|uniref:Sensor-like histidine kinase SenX3 n=1 Tax=Naasia lichenicola TaxID=2565933 RepID=A0A4S4FRA9_9MICO|nr:ATP-binding protein [Naasia lichenicola]THG32838.1 hypothetical protein E6C64_00185 [Naasia lichenicola]